MSPHTPANSPPPRGPASDPSDGATQEKNGGAATFDGASARPAAMEAGWVSRGLIRLIGDDTAYLLPMCIFLIFTWAGGRWHSLYVASYIAKTLLAALLLIVLWRHYTKVRWHYWWLGILLGMIGVVQWVGMEKGLLHIWPNYPRMTGPVFNPFEAFSSVWQAWAFIAIRWAGAALVVPVMEELFWRDYLWRTISAPADFRVAPIGDWDRGIPLIVVSLLFCSVHFEWITAIVWGLMIGGLLIFTRSIGACILMHCMTNFLLGLYVLITHDWKFW